MIDNMTQQQRMILALVLSFIFFIAYDFMMPKPIKVAESNQSIETDVKSSTDVDYSAPVSNSIVTSSTKTVATDSNSSNSSKEATKVVDTVKSQTPLSLSSTIVTVEAKDFKLTIDRLGRISKYEVLNNRFLAEDGTYPNLVSDRFNLKPLEIRFADGALNSEAFSVAYSADRDKIVLDGTSQTVVLTQKLSTNSITKKITFNSNGTYSVDILIDKPSEYYLSPGFRPDTAVDMYTFKGALIKKADGTIETIEDGDAEGTEVFMGASILSLNDRYYTTAFYDFENRVNIFISKDSEDRSLAFIKGSSNMSVNGYIGPKEYDKMAAIDKRLTDIIEYGFFTFLAKPVFLFLKYLYSIIGNWGWAIVAITIIIRFVLYPLTYKGMVSMNKIKELSPKMKEIQKKYKGEPQKMNAKMMELYKKHNANPMGGCLPMLLQIPIFFAIYRVLLNSIELKHAEWILWYKDLSVMDPYFILPILMGASMYWQQVITPTNFTDPLQEKIMKFLPVIFTFFFMTFPAGLTLYWFVNNLFSVAQQYYVNSIFDKQRAKKEAENAKS